MTNSKEKTVYVYLASGFEETEAIFPIDLMRRAELNVVTVSITKDRAVCGSHGIEVRTDITVFDEAYKPENAVMLVIPGGMPGTLNLNESSHVQKAIKDAFDADRYLAAICAAPLILGEAGMLQNKCATCYPGFEKHLHGAVKSLDPCVTDGKIITAEGCGRAMEFGLAIVAELCGKEKSESIKNGIRA